MLWKKLRSTTNPLSNPSVHKQCLRKAKTAELWSGRYTLGFNQEAPLGAFMERADTVHSRKRQTVNRPFFSLNISIRKQEIYEAEKKHRYILRNSWEVCILSAVPQVIESDTFMTMMAPKRIHTL